jgi:hypothetical protein
MASTKGKKSAPTKLVRNPNAKVVKTDGNTRIFSTSKSGGGSTGNANGLNSTQIDQLKGMKGIDQNLLANYKPGTGAITPASMTPTQPMNVTPPVAPSNVPDIGALNSALGKTDPTGALVVDPITQNSINNQTTAFNDYQSQIQDIQAPDIIGIQKKLDRQTGIDDLKSQEAEYSSQLNSIVANRDANMLKLEGQGRGITDVIIGGQQAQVQKEAAIAALPVQAQLAAVQGKIQVATDYINKWGSLLVQDATNKFNQKTKLAESAYAFASDIEKQKLTSLMTQAKEKKDSEIALANAKAAAISDALSKGFGAGAVSKLQAATNMEQLALATPRPIVTAKAAEAPTVKTINGVDMQWNPTTGQWETIAGANAPGADGTQKTLDQISFLKTTINDADGLVDATGPNMITKGLGNLLVGNTRVKQLANKIDTLKTNLLTLNSDPALKKFFGPQMTEKDTQLLMSAGSTLNAYDSNEKDNAAELARYAELLNRMETAIVQGQKATMAPVVQTGPDGVVYQFID